MGKYNSSIYRVRPLMEIIKNDYSSFVELLKLVKISPLGTPKIFKYDGEDCKEMQLKPTKQHLLKLIDYLTNNDQSKISVAGADRQALFYGNTQTKSKTAEKAKRELILIYDKLTASDRPWYMFEGFTNPDIFIEGNDYVIVCEGKWTEPHITTTTTYLSKNNASRNQMIRHIQGALNYTNKRVYAFYIVDAECGYINDLSKESFINQLNQETIQPDDAEKVNIVNAYCGYTTWQDIKKVIPNVIFKEKTEITDD